MSARKRPLSNSVNDFFRNSNLQDDFNISSYSSSEEENETKKFHISVTASENLDESLKISEDSNFSLCNISTTIDESQDYYNSNSSPIIGTGKLDRLSPILESTYTDISEDLSPIIGRTQTWNIKRRKNPLCRKLQFSESFLIPGEGIEMHESKNNCKISPIGSDENLVIGSFSSDNLDKVVINSATTDTSSAKSFNEPLYQEPKSPKRKKRYKKGGFAFQLEKVLDRQHAVYAIFRHELYLNKTRDWITIDESLTLIVKINKIWKDCGVTMIYCDYLNLHDNVKLVDHFKKESRSCEIDVDFEKCLITVGFNVTHNLNIKVDAKLKLYQPFKTKVIEYGNNAIYCHFNMCRIFSEK